MDLTTFIIQISITAIFSKMLAFGFYAQEENKCVSLYTRNRMSKIRCYKMDLKEVPQHLKSSVEILDLSMNRIKKLKTTSFQKYTKLKSLLLYENMIIHIESGTFEQLTNLEEIDLSNNGLMTLPLEIFSLPSLRNLYVDSNSLTDLTQDLKTLTKPIEAPLEYLNVANCELDEIPDLGLLPNLWQINASSNPLTNFNIKVFANMCHLTSIGLLGTSISDCACQQINSHLRVIGAKTQYTPVCLENLNENICPLPFNNTIDTENFALCKNMQKKAETTKLFVVAGCWIGGVLLALILVFYCIHRYRRKRAKKKIHDAKLDKNRVISPKNAINNNCEQNNALLHCDNI